MSHLPSQAVSKAVTIMQEGLDEQQQSMADAEAAQDERIGAVESAQAAQVTTNANVQNQITALQNQFNGISGVTDA